MRKLILFVGILSGFLSADVFSQNDTVKSAIDFSGFINNETMYNTRQNVAAREGEVLLYPKPIQLGPNEKDINAQPNFNMLSIHTRLTGQLSHLKAFGAQTSGKIQIDFFGTTEENMHLLRMRHAYLNMDWGKTELLFGQTWHPMFIPECFPTVVSWGGGIPIHVLSRNPQVRLTHNPVKNLSLSLTALTHRTYASTGQYGKSSEYLRNSGIPSLQFQFMYGMNTNFTGGFTAGYKTLVPRLQANNGNKVDESISSFNANAFLKYQTDRITLKCEGIYGQNMNNFVMLGGYAVSDSSNTGKYSYTNIPSGSVWIEGVTHFDKVDLGLFGGISKHFGAESEILDNNLVYARGSDIDYVYRIAPKIAYHSGKVELAFEVNYTAAAYGTTNENLEVQNPDEVGNTRFLFSIFRYF